MFIRIGDVGVVAGICVCLHTSNFSICITVQSTEDITGNRSRRQITTGITAIRLTSESQGRLAVDSLGLRIRKSRSS